MKDTLTLSLILFICRGIISAALLSSSDPRFGENSLTLDTSTGLAWLDLPMSVGLSYNQVLAATQPDGPFAGFRFATREEITDLFRSAGLPGEGFFPESGTNTANILQLISLVGATSSHDGRAEALGITGSPAPPVGVNSLHYTEYIEFLYGSTVPGYGLASFNAFGDGYGTYTVGSWLVESVPEPTSWGIGMIAGVMLVGRRCLNLGHNNLRQPTPVERQLGCSPSATRRGCAKR